MTVEIRTTGVKPVRNTFAHLAKRFGDKPATRYQEIAYDVQPSTNFHYKPLWDPEHELFDVRRTQVVMKDWYALKDPRQYYYGAYTTTRAKQQEALDRTLEFVEKRDLLRGLPLAARTQIVEIVVPLRHYEFGANMNNAHVSAYGYGTALTQAAMMNCMDRLGMAQHLSRIGLITDGNSGESLTAGKKLWMDAPQWQGVRREMENLFVTRDPVENLVLQNLVADALVYPLVFQQFDAAFAKQNGSGLSSLTDYLMRWYEETAKWVDAVVKTMAAESPENNALISGWVAQGRDTWLAALAPLAQAGLGDAAASALETVKAAFNTRAGKLGLKL
jgi:phenol/toluene 2-monooxygenase (NADH) P1/A1